MNIAVLCGGVGAARLLCGFSSLTKEDPNLQVTAIVNTGDDDEFYGFYVCPDIDSVLYHLADLHDDERGWGRTNETFNFVKTLNELDQNAWFNLGDKDLALNYIRTSMLNQGKSISEATEYLCELLKITQIKIIPMCEEKVRTRILTSDNRDLSMQEYFVKERCAPTIEQINYLNAPLQMDKNIFETISNADKIIIAPSNPFLSINPILSIGGVRELLQANKNKIIAISPIVSGKAIKGPLAEIMKNYSMEVSSLGIARLYIDFVSQIVIDESDKNLSTEISKLGISPIVLDTIMNSHDKRINLAKRIVSEF